MRSLGIIVPWNCAATFSVHLSRNVNIFIYNRPISSYSIYRYDVPIYLQLLFHKQCNAYAIYIIYIYNNICIQKWLHTIDQIKRSQNDRQSPLQSQFRPRAAKGIVAVEAATVEDNAYGSNGAVISLPIWVSKDGVGPEWKSVKLFLYHMPPTLQHSLKKARYIWEGWVTWIPKKTRNFFLNPFSGGSNPGRLLGFIAFSNSSTPIFARTIRGSSPFFPDGFSAGDLPGDFWGDSLGDFPAALEDLLLLAGLALTPFTAWSAFLGLPRGLFSWGFAWLFAWLLAFALLSLSAAFWFFSSKMHWSTWHYIDFANCSVRSDHYFKTLNHARKQAHEDWHWSCSTFFRRSAWPVARTAASAPSKASAAFRLDPGDKWSGKAAGFCTAGPREVLDWALALAVEKLTINYGLGLALGSGKIIL